MQNNRTSLRRLTIGSFLAFFLFGFADNLKGPTLPAVLQELNFSYAQGGTIMLGAYVGFLIATLVTGILSDRVGNKAVILVACACLLPGLLGYGTFSAFGALLAAMTAIGLGLGSIEVGGNLIIVDLYTQNKGRYLNLLAFFHGVGSMLAPLYAGRLLAVGVSWRHVYQISSILVIALANYFLFIKYSRKASAESQHLDLKHVGKSAFTADMILFYILIAMYVAAEIGIGAWVVEFLQQVKSQSVMLSSLFLSLFFGTITVGRFLGSFLVEKIGYLNMMIYTSIASIVCIGIGIFAPPALAFFLPLTGLFFSIMFPTTTAAVSDLHKENIGTILGLLFTFAGVGGMLGPWLIGLVSDWAGLTWGFSMLLVFCVVMWGSLIILKSQTAVPEPEAVTQG
jgi:fucose permease